jgi:hypothetical protein
MLVNSLLNCVMDSVATSQFLIYYPYSLTNQNLCSHDVTNQDLFCTLPIHVSSFLLVELFALFSFQWRRKAPLLLKVGCIRIA